MMQRAIAVAVVCLSIGASASARAQEARDEVADDEASASAELSLSVSPRWLLTQGGLGGLGGTGGVGSLGVVPGLDVGFALDPSVFLVLGISGSYARADGAQLSITVPFSVLWYLEAPRVGRVMPILRVGGAVGYSRAEYGAFPPYEGYLVDVLARGGITWIAARPIALRAEIGLRGSGQGLASDGVGMFTTQLGLDASVSVVLRV